MDDKGWSCCAQLQIPDIVRQVHVNYINSGASIITANTYATNKNVMGPAGYGERTDEVNKTYIYIISFPKKHV